MNFRIATILLSKQIDDRQRDEKERYDGTAQANRNGVAEKKGVHVVAGFIEFINHGFGLKPGIQSALYASH